MTIKIEAAEKDIEDVLCNHMRHYLGLRFIGRQINTPAGKIDILAKGPHNLYYIIELKRGDVDASAYAQVMRYCHYFNYNKSKNGKRIFAPLLIGENLSGEMVKNVKNFDKGGEGFSVTCSIPEYALFQFNPLSGISFSYYNAVQRTYEEEHFFNQQNYLEAFHENLEHSNFNYFYEITKLKEIIAGEKNEKPLV